MKRIVSLLAAAAFVASLLAAAGRPARILLITGQSDERYHDWRSTSPFLKKVLESTGRFDVRVTEEPRGLTREALSGYDAVLLNYNGPRWDAEAESALDEFVRSGKGIVTFHGMSYGPLMGTVLRPGGGWDLTAPWKAYTAMIGATWAPANIGHAARHAFTVKLAADGGPLTQGMAPEFTVNDELYHRLDLSPSAHVLATAFDDPAYHGTGKQEPMAWTVPYGKGRAFHCTLGHDTNALYQPEVMALFARAVEWAATGSVTLAPEIDPFLPATDAIRVLVVTGGHAYEPSFYGLFEGQPDIRWCHVCTQKEAFSRGLKDHWDVLVLYDMGEQIGDEERQNLRAFVEAGKGVVALHHAIVDYTSWPWWYEEVIGGKFFVKAEGDHPASHYKEGLPMVVRTVPAMRNHPIVRGLGDLVTVDECYRGMWFSPRITVLMETQNEFNDRPVVYLGPNPAFRAVYIQLGHGSYTHNHPGYRELVRNAILWAAGRAR